MAELTTYQGLTLVELAKRSHNNKALKLANTLVQRNDILSDAVWAPANSGSFHVFGRVSDLPDGAWRIVNGGIDESSGQSYQVSEPIARFEGQSKIDEAALDMVSDPLAHRRIEDDLFLEGMAQGFVAGMLYGNKGIDPEKLHGFMNRYGALTAGYVWGAGGTGNDVTSILIVEWGPDTCFLAYPEANPTLAVKRMDRGIQRVLDGNSKPYFAYVTEYVVQGALCVKDPRAVQRVANIETTGSSNIFDPDLVIKALNSMPSFGERSIIYVNRTLKSQMDINAKDKNNVYYTSREIFGRSVTEFRGVPVHLCEQILDTESAIT